MTKVHAIRIIGTNRVVWSAWERLQWDEDNHASHSTWERFEDQWYGRLGTRNLPPDLERMHGEERYIAVKRFQNAQYNAAYKAIWPHISHFHTSYASMGEIGYDCEACANLVNRGEIPVPSESEVA